MRLKGACSTSEHEEPPLAGRGAAAEADLGFAPIIAYEEGWQETIAWFREHWLPTYERSSGWLGIATQSQAKIDIQEASRQADLKAKAA